MSAMSGHAERDPEWEYEASDEDFKNQPDEPSDNTNIEVYEDNLDESDEFYGLLSNSTTNDEALNTENNGLHDIGDYQIEDNRSEVKEDKRESAEMVENFDDFNIPLHNEESAVNNDKQSNEINQKFAVENEAAENYDYASYMYDDLDHVVPNTDAEERNRGFNHDKFDDFDQIQESNLKQSIDDLRRLLNGTEVNDDQYSEDDLVYSDDQNANILKLLEETQRILEESDNSFDEEGEKANTDEKLTSTIVTDNTITAGDNNGSENTKGSQENKYDTSTEKYNIDEDTVAKAYSELQDDLNHLRETWTKLKDEVTDTNINLDNLPGFKELDINLENTAQETQDESEDDYEVIEDKNLFMPPKTPPDDLSEEDEDDDDDDDNVDNIIDEIVEKEADAVEPTLPLRIESKTDSPVQIDKMGPKIIPYVDDALNANEGSKIVDDDNELSVDNISPNNLKIEVHKVEVLDDDNKKQSTEPIKITLSVDTPVVLTSPNYPDPYPSNSLNDWILEGEGMGIEFNITDFSLNRLSEDYVLIKPGRVDMSGDDGILLSGDLEPRAFRFLDVNRVAVRFESLMWLNQFRGFSFSVKMINPPLDNRAPEPEALPIGYPESTITLNLGGITLDNFLLIEEDFRRIVADMATMYIEANLIDPGLNTTRQVTQITSRALCFHNWPQFEQCAEVRFGVPLQYADEEAEPRLSEDDLRDMWFTYASQNPFALRLQQLGITEFQVPNDSNVLMVWLVIAAGVVISMAMLAFALWRFSCFEDYTKMPSFSDTESVNEKKTLDLYPTPHQTLPPLYSDTDYKWGESKYDNSTRVDLGGYPNRSYVRTEDFDFDSEEEVAVPARDRYTTDV